MAKTKKPAETNGEPKPRRTSPAPRRRKAAQPGDAIEKLAASPAVEPHSTSAEAPQPAVGGDVVAPVAVAVPATASGAAVATARGIPSAPAGSTFFESQRPAMTYPRREDIARRAYEIFCERGRTHGHHLEDWLRAERELQQRGRQGS
ncbi:MAG: DUF2934 domain-containing protein [Vicinamibacterales bacterium]